MRGLARRSLIGSLSALTLAWASPGAMAAAVPAPVERVRTAHRLVALALREETPFDGWSEVLHELRRRGAHATLFVTPQLVRRDARELRALMRSGTVEVGLAGTGGLAAARRLPQDAQQATRLLGDQMGLYQPPPRGGGPSRAPYEAGLVTVRWSRTVPQSTQHVALQTREVEPGDILRFDLGDAQGSVARLQALLVGLGERNLLVTSAGALIQDSEGHLGYCMGPVPEDLAFKTGPGARKGAPTIDAVYPSAGPAPRALWRLGRVGRHMVRRIYGVKPGVLLGEEPISGLLENEARARVAEIAARLYQPAVDATIAHPSGSLVPDRPGRRVDADATLRRIWSAEQDARVGPVIRLVHARWRTADLAALTTVIGRYRTWIDGAPGRYDNVEKGADRINNRIVFPGQTFSTLEAIGDVTKQPGWHRAPVIISGSYVEGVGGGLCQVSSTLYNAVAQAKLRIVERHHHAKQVHYVPRGRDATIAWPALDFRFQNDRKTPIVVKSYVRGGALWAVVQGNAAG